MNTGPIDWKHFNRAEHSGPLYCAEMGHCYGTFTSLDDALHKTTNFPNSNIVVARSWEEAMKREKKPPKWNDLFTTDPNGLRRQVVYCGAVIVTELGPVEESLGVYFGPDNPCNFAGPPRPKEDFTGCLERAEIVAVGQALLTIWSRPEIKVAGQHFQSWDIRVSSQSLADKLDYFVLDHLFVNNWYQGDRRVDHHCELHEVYHWLLKMVGVCPDKRRFTFTYADPFGEGLKKCRELAAIGLEQPFFDHNGDGPVYYAVPSGWRRGIFMTIDAAREAALNHPNAQPQKFTVLEKAQKHVNKTPAFVQEEDDEGNTRNVVYTDGACQDNGKRKAKGGMGVFFGKGHVSNFSGPLSEQKDTNQKAELMAIYHALRLISSYSKKLIWDIRTESQYAINCITNWAETWKQNGWIDRQGSPVENCDIVKKILQLMEDLEEAKWDDHTSVVFTHVTGHTGNTGNEAADKLAKEGIDGPEDIYSAYDTSCDVRSELCC